MDLKALVFYIEPQLGGHIFPVPLHKGGIDVENLITVQANNLGFKGFRASIEGVKLIVMSHIDFSNHTAFHQEEVRQRYTVARDTVSSRLWASWRSCSAVKWPGCLNRVLQIPLFFGRSYASLCLLESQKSSPSSRCTLETMSKFLTIQKSTVNLIETLLRLNGLFTRIENPLK